MKNEERYKNYDGWIYLCDWINDLCKCSRNNLNKMEKNKKK